MLWQQSHQVSLILYCLPINCEAIKCKKEVFLSNVTFAVPFVMRRRNVQVIAQSQLQVFGRGCYAKLVQLHLRSYVPQNEKQLGTVKHKLKCTHSWSKHEVMPGGERQTFCCHVRGLYPTQTTGEYYSLSGVRALCWDTYVCQLANIVHLCMSSFELVTLTIRHDCRDMFDFKLPLPHTVMYMSACTLMHTLVPAVIGRLSAPICICSHSFFSTTTNCRVG